MLVEIPFKIPYVRLKWIFVAKISGFRTQVRSLGESGEIYVWALKEKRAEEEAGLLLRCICDPLGNIAVYF